MLCDHGHSEIRRSRCAFVVWGLSEEYRDWTTDELTTGLYHNARAICMFFDVTRLIYFLPEADGRFFTSSALVLCSKTNLVLYLDLDQRIRIPAGKESKSDFQWKRPVSFDGWLLACVVVVVVVVVASDKGERSSTDLLWGQRMEETAPGLEIGRLDWKEEQQSIENEAVHACKRRTEELKEKDEEQGSTWWRREGKRREADEVRFCHGMEPGKRGEKERRKKTRVLALV